jgi:hypothetical protein
MYSSHVLCYAWFKVHGAMNLKIFLICVQYAIGTCNEELNVLRSTTLLVNLLKQHVLALPERRLYKNEVLNQTLESHLDNP